MYSGYSGHVYSDHSDIVATFPGTKCIHSIIFRSDIVAKVATVSDVHCTSKWTFPFRFPIGLLKNFTSATIIQNLQSQKGQEGFIL